MKQRVLFVFLLWACGLSARRTAAGRRFMRPGSAAAATLWSPIGGRLGNSKRPDHAVLGQQRVATAGAGGTS